MSYTIDMKSIPVRTYFKILKTQDLLPGRRILLNDIEINFQKIIDTGISNLFELKNRLSTPQKISAFSSASAISEDYLTMLKREMGSLEQKPVLISEFPGIHSETVSRLSNHNIRTSKDFFDLCILNEHVGAVHTKTGISENEISELSCLCNLVRINGVGAIAAKTIYESGYKSVREIAQADAADMLKRVSEVNSDRHYYKAKLGVNDMQFVINFANLILDVEQNELPV